MHIRTRTLALMITLGATFACGGAMGEAMNEAKAKYFAEMKAKLAAVSPSPDRDGVTLLLDEGYVQARKGNLDVTTHATFKATFESAIDDGIITSIELADLGLAGQKFMAAAPGIDQLEREILLLDLAAEEAASLELLTSLGLIYIPTMAEGYELRFGPAKSPTDPEPTSFSGVVPTGFVGLQFETEGDPFPWDELETTLYFLEDYGGKTLQTQSISNMGGSKGYDTYWKSWEITVPGTYEVLMRHPVDMTVIAEDRFVVQ